MSRLPSSGSAAASPGRRHPTPLVQSDALRRHQVGQAAGGDHGVLAGQIGAARWKEELVPLIGEMGKAIEMASGSIVRRSHNNGDDQFMWGFRLNFSLRDGVPVGFTNPMGQLYDIDRIDPYDRALVYVWLDGRLFNATLVRRGFATVEIYEPNDRYETKLRRLQRRARNADRGLWGAC